MLQLLTSSLAFYAPTTTRLSHRASAGPCMSEDAHCTVVFLRHGQSTWNAGSLFTGWADVELTTLGKNEAAKAATLIWKEGINLDVAYSSRLKRAKQTLDIVLRISGQEHVPVNACWRLNERMYGGLTGLNKKETAAKYGDAQVKEWRRSYDTRPPDIDPDSEYYPGNDPQYWHIPEEELPLAECLKDTLERTLPYWQSDITPALEKGKTVLVAAHGNSIRGILKYLDDIPEDKITVRAASLVALFLPSPLTRTLCLALLTIFSLPSAGAGDPYGRAFSLQARQGPQTDQGAGCGRAIIWRLPWRRRRDCGRAPGRRRSDQGGEGREVWRGRRAGGRRLSGDG